MGEAYYEQDGITIYHGDCREVLAECDANAWDLVLTDPPYNFGKEYDQHDDRMDPAAYEAWCAEWFALCRQAAPRQVVFPGNGNIGMWYRIHKPTAVGCWYKPGNRASSVLGFEDWEPWLYWHGGNKGLLGGSSVIRQLLEHEANDRNRARPHPCPKPVGLMSKLIKKTRTEAVVDPFMGSGTTLVAAKLHGIRAAGIEISERYCEIAAKRLAQGTFDFASVGTPDG